MCMDSPLGLRWKLFAFVVWICSFGWATTTFGQLALDDGPEETGAAASLKVASESKAVTDSVEAGAGDVYVRWNTIIYASLPDDRRIFELNGNQSARVDDPSPRGPLSSELSWQALAAKEGFSDDLSDFAVTRDLLARIQRNGSLRRLADHQLTTKSGCESKYEVEWLPGSRTLCVSVTPVPHDDTISMEIDCSVQWEADSASIDKNNGYPILHRRSRSTKEDIKDGKFIVITFSVPRYVIESSSTRDTLGVAEKQEASEEVELALFISPSIVRE